MLWKPAAPVYPKLIQEAPEGLMKAEADELRRKGQNLLPICKLSKDAFPLWKLQSLIKLVAICLFYHHALLSFLRLNIDVCAAKIGIYKCMK